MANNLPLEIKYSGQDVDDGSMPISDVVSALKGFADAYTEVAIFKKTEAKHTIRINGIRKGSVSFLLEVVENVSKNQEALIATAGSAAAIIGVIFQSVDFFRHSKGKEVTAKISQQGTNNIIIENCDGVSISFPLEVYEIYEEGMLKQHLSKLCDPLESGQVDSVSISSNFNNATKEISISSKEKEFFQYSAKEVTETREMVLTGHLVSLNKERNGGSFRLQDGTRISYKIKSDHPESLFKHILHKGMVKIKCIAHIDENLKPIRLEIIEIEDIEPALFNEK